jgi:hypothetical protein
MAGSWRHATDDQGRLISNSEFVDMIENLGDAYEMAEEMVVSLASYQIMPHNEDVLAAIERARGNYRAGLELGGMHPQF